MLRVVSYGGPLCGPRSRDRSYAAGACPLPVYPGSHSPPLTPADVRRLHLGASSSFRSRGVDRTRRGENSGGEVFPAVSFITFGGYPSPGDYRCWSQNLNILERRFSRLRKLHRNRPLYFLTAVVVLKISGSGFEWSRIFANKARAQRHTMVTRAGRNELSLSARGL